MEFQTAFLTLLLVMDPLGNVPIFLSALKDVEPKRRRWVIARELVIALIILVIILLVGTDILNALALDRESISIGGAIVLFIIAIRMIFPPPQGGIMGAQYGGEPFIVPLAIPLVAGPSTMAFLMLIVLQDPNRMLEWAGALFGAWVVSSVILLSSTKLYRLLGERGLIAMERLMGMMLVMLSVQMFIDGVATFFNLR